MVTGTVTELWRYPVKSMLGERIDSTDIGKHGVVGDRSFALIDTETGKVCSAKRHDLWGGLFRFHARLERPGLATMTFPDGSEHTTDEAGIDDALSDVLGRRVHLSSTAPEGAVIEEIWDDAKGDQMYGPASGEAEGQTVIDVTASLAAPGDFFDLCAIHLITTNSIEAFAGLEQGSTFDVRRFRPNILVEVGDQDGFVENEWKVIRIGDLELRTLMPVPRCVMTTLEQEDLPRDPNILRSAARHNMLDTKVVGQMPCAGLYLSVANGSTVTVGDTVTAELG